MKDEPKKITATLKVVIAGEFYDDEASEETLRYCVEQDLEDAGFDVDVAMLKEQEPVPPAKAYSGGGKTWWYVCGDCLTAINPNDKFCHECGMAVKWNEQVSVCEAEVWEWQDAECKRAVHHLLHV